MLSRAGCIARRILRIWTIWITTTCRNHIILDRSRRSFYYFNFILKRILTWLLSGWQCEGSAQS